MTDQPTRKLVRKIERKLADALAILELADGAWTAGHELSCSELRAVLDGSIPKIRTSMSKLDRVRAGPQGAASEPLNHLPPPSESYAKPASR